MRRWWTIGCCMTLGCLEGVLVVDASTNSGREPGDETSDPTTAGGEGGDASDADEDSGAGESGGGSSPADWAGGPGGDGEPDEPDDGPPAIVYFECASERGIDVQHDAIPHPFSSPGQAWADIDRDGWLDVVLTNQLRPNRVFLGTPSGEFSSPGWAGDIARSDSISAGVVFGDYDNDGWSDLYVLEYGPNRLFRNLGGHGFVDVTELAGVGNPGVGETATWGDFDNDGFIDLYVVNNDIATPDSLYRNRGDGSFADASDLLDVDIRARPAFSASFFDYDLDGDRDLYVVNDKRVGNVLWRNDGPGCGGWCFTDVSHESGADVELCSMGLAIGDYDRDGDQDLFVTSVGPMKLLQNQIAQGEAVFVDVSVQAGATIDVDGWGEVGWGTQFVDYDNDGWLDLYVALGKQDPGPESPNILLHNDRDGSFTAAAEVGGAADPRVSFGLATADHDNDGWVDLLIGNLGESYALYCNDGAAHYGDRHWLTIELRAEQSGGAVNAEAIGARVYVHDDHGHLHMREIIAGSSLAAGSSLRAHVGLGSALPNAVVVVWPDGRVDQWQHPPVDTHWIIEYAP